MSYTSPRYKGKSVKCRISGMGVKFRLYSNGEIVDKKTLKSLGCVEKDKLDYAWKLRGLGLDNFLKKYI